MQRLHSQARQDAPMPAGGPGRTRRTPGGPTVGLQARVPLHVRERANAVADALGISLGLYIEQLVTRDELDERGRSLWAADADILQSLDDQLPGMTTSAA